jgi:hypothetical protein
VEEIERRVNLYPGTLPVYKHWRDELGRDKLTQLVDIVKQSEKVIILLNREFLDIKWNEYSTNYAIIKSLDIDDVIPVILPGGFIPEQLISNEIVEFSDTWKTEEDNWSKLIHTICQKHPEQIPTQGI